MTVDSDIRSLLNQTHQLERQIDSARARRDAAKRRADEMAKRQSQVQSVKNALSSSFDGSVSSLQRKQDGVKNQLGSATSGMRRESALVSAVEADRERHTESDGLLGSAHANLQQEINECQRKFEEAKREMDEADAQARSLANRHASVVNRAKTLSEQEGATITVRERAWY